MQLVLEGEIITPIITKRPKFHLAGCLAVIKSPRRRYYGKITTSKPMYPYAFTCFLGTLVLRFTTKSKQLAKKKLAKLLRITQIGRFQGEGLGRVRWLEGRIITTQKAFSREQWKIRIRKGLPAPLPDPVKDLIQYALLHDFVHTDQHLSKIYVEVPLVDQALLELLRQHHTKTEQPLISAFQPYDRWAARLTRKIRAPTQDRYCWQAKSIRIDFDQLAKELAQVAENVWKLYDFVYQRKELDQLVEGLEYGHTSFQEHLLLVVNLIVQDWLAGKLGSLSHGRDSVKLPNG
ncbi:MAG: hypothetical protein ACE5OZ_14080 [Candidatus Heimdallarchaeota archaeon]